MANKPKITNAILVECLREQAKDVRQDLTDVLRFTRASLARFEATNEHEALFVENARSLRTLVDQLVEICVRLRAEARIEGWLVDAGVIPNRS